MIVQANRLLKTSVGQYGLGELIEGLPEDEATLYRRKGWVTVVAVDDAQMPPAGSGDASPASTADDDAEPAQTDVGPYECPHCEKTYETEGWLTRHLDDKHPSQTVGVESATEGEEVN